MALPFMISSSLGLMRAAAAGVDPEWYFRRRAAASDPVTLAFPGLGEVLFFGTKQAARDIFTTPPTLCRAPTPNPIEPIVGEGSLILLSGEQHRRERSLLMPAFHGERMKGYVDLIATAATDEIGTLRPGDAIAVRELALAIALQVVIRVVFGVGDPKRREKYAEVIKELMRANTAPLMLVPALRHSVGGRGPWAKLLRLRDHLDSLLSDEMKGRQRSGLQAQHMLDLLMSATDEDGQHHSEQEMHDQLRTLLAAGHETSASSLSWALYHIYRDDSVRERLIAELWNCTTPLEMTSLPYLDAVIRETLRMHPIVPIVLRRLLGPVTVDGVSCSEGDVVGIALYALHFNPSIWPDAERFDPDRFMGKRTSPFEYAPFGGGHRRCIGSAFAACELAISIGTIMKNVELRMPASEVNRKPPRSVPRGIAVLPNREIALEVVGSAASQVAESPSALP